MQFPSAVCSFRMDQEYILFSRFLQFPRYCESVWAVGAPGRCIRGIGGPDCIPSSPGSGCFGEGVTDLGRSTRRTGDAFADEAKLFSKTRGGSWKGYEYFVGTPPEIPMIWIRCRTSMRNW